MRVRVAGRPHVRVLFHLPEKIGKEFFFSFFLSSDGRLMKGEETPADERRSNDDGKMEMSSGARIGFR